MWKKQYFHHCIWEALEPQKYSNFGKNAFGMPLLLIQRYIRKSNVLIDYCNSQTVRERTATISNRTCQNWMLLQPSRMSAKLRTLNHNLFFVLFSLSHSSLSAQFSLKFRCNNNMSVIRKKHNKILSKIPENEQKQDQRKPQLLNQMMKTRQILVNFYTWICIHNSNYCICILFLSLSLCSCLRRTFKLLLFKLLYAWPWKNKSFLYDFDLNGVSTATASSFLLIIHFFSHLSSLIIMIMAINYYVMD